MTLDDDDLSLLAAAVTAMILSDTGRVARGSMLGLRLARLRVLRQRLRDEKRHREEQAARATERAITVDGQVVGVVVTHGSVAAITNAIDADVATQAPDKGVVTFDHSAQVYEAWSDKTCSVYLGAYDTIKEARDAITARQA